MAESNWNKTLLKPTKLNGIAEDVRIRPNKSTTTNEVNGNRRRSLIEAPNISLINTPALRNAKSPSLYNVSSSLNRTVRPASSIIEIAENPNKRLFYSSRFMPTYSANIQKGVSSLQLSTINMNFKIPHSRFKAIELSSDEIFDKEAVEVIIEEELREKLVQLKSMTYHPSICKRFTELLAKDIMQKISLLKYDKYRHIILVHIGKVGQSQDEFYFKTRSLWNCKYDQTISVYKHHKDLFGLVELFMVT